MSGHQLLRFRVTLDLTLDQREQVNEYVRAAKADQQGAFGCPIDFDAALRMALSLGLTELAKLK